MSEPLASGTEYKQTRCYAFAYLTSQFLIFFAAIGAVFMAKRSLNSLNDSVKAANQQSIISRQQFELSERPWIGLLHTDILDYPKDNRLNVAISYNNTGHSPAEQVWLRAIAFAPLGSKQYVKAEEWCADKPTYSGVGLLVMPGQEYHTEISSESLAPNTLTYILESLKNTPTSQRTPNLHPEGVILIGCLDYRWNQHCYRTRFCAQYNAKATDHRPFGELAYCNFSNNTDENPDCEPPK
jgi:hypothetical protein